MVFHSENTVTCSETGLLEVFGFDSVYETQSQTSLKHNGIIKWGFFKRSLPSENQEEEEGRDFMAITRQI